ncbi:MAG TPA: hypothetical protein VHV77_12580 [Pirellulales bacterium]|jgi:hypothetical protein|nr:hypothetical protein [Pirellulales bacterium]
MKKLISKLALAVLIGAGYVGLVLHFSGNPAYAQKQYKDAFEAKYPDFAPIKEVKCGLCHPNPETKKERNEYGKALGKALGATKVKDVDKINAALTKIAGEKSSSGETFGERIKEGKLPASK